MGLITALSAAACSGTNGPLDAGSDGGNTTGASGGAPGTGAAPGLTSSGGQTNGSVSSGGTASGGGSAMVDCTKPVAPRSPLRRMTRFEYNNTVRDLLDIDDSPADALPGEELGNGFGNEADTLGVSRLLIDGYRTIAQDIATSLTSDAASVIELAGCDATQTGEDACRQQFIESFGERAFRRPLEATEVAALSAAFARGQELGGDFASGVRAVVEVTLQLPQFLYRLEFGEPAATAELGRPTSHEMASRLSYMLWGSMPDQELLDAADQNLLVDPAEILAQAARMLEDPRARDVVRYFHDQLYGLGGLDALQRSPEHYPTFQPGMGSLFRQETQTFIDHVVWEGEGDFATLMTAPYTFVNGTLADFYGIPGITGDEFQQVDLDPTQRAGILTQASILASTTPGSRTNPIVRADWMLSRVLCVEVQDPPVGLMIEEPEVVPGLTTRERFAAHREDPSCGKCHEVLDPIGFGFENYDGVGLWRDMDNGLPIDASGELPLTDAGGLFTGPVELAARLAQSQDAQHCYIGSWLRFGYGLSESPREACSLISLEQAFHESGGDVKQLLLALTQTDTFLYRPLADAM